MRGVVKDLSELVTGYPVPLGGKIPVSGSCLLPSTSGDGSPLGCFSVCDRFLVSHKGHPSFTWDFVESLR